MAFALIASASGQTDANSATTGAINTTGANLLVVVCADDGGSAVSAISDSKGNSWTALTSQLGAASGRCTIFYSIPTSVGASHTFTATRTSGFPSISVAAFSGAAGVSVFDQQNGANTAGATSLATGSVTPSQDNELLIAGIASGDGGSPTIDLSFTRDSTIAFSAGVGYQSAIAHLIETTATAKNPTWTPSGSVFMAVAIATFKAVAVPPPGKRHEPNPVLAVRPSDRFGFSAAPNLPLFLYVPPPPPPISTYGRNWPNPVLRVNAPAWQQSETLGLCIPRDADYFYGLVYISIAGVARAQGRIDTGARIDFDSLTINDIQAETPNTCSFVAHGFTPVEGQEVIITLGSATRQNPERIFAGTILSVEPFYNGTPLNQSFNVSCIDWTWQLNRRKVITRYTAQSASLIASDLIATYASGFTSAYVAPGLESIDEITFTNQDLTAALSQLAKRIGASWYIDYLKRLHFFIRESDANPVALTAAHPSLTAFRSRSDLSQWITRAFSEGGGGNASSAVAVGETILPVDDASWYEDLGGVVVCGPQRLTYSGRMLGGGGGLVGPGASPTSALTTALASGAGVETGAHDYAITFVTAAGESIAGPRASIAVGLVSAPASAPTAGSPTAGAGVTTGAHTYAVTFVTAAGETTSSPISGSVSTGPVTSPALDPPVTAPTATASTYGGMAAGSHNWAVTFVNANGETTAGPLLTQTLGATATPFNTPICTGTTGGALTPGSLYLYHYTFTDAAGRETVVNQSGAGSVTLTGGQNAVNLSGLSVSVDVNVTKRKIYRTVAGGGGTYKLVATINDNTTTTYTDTTADGSLGADAPTVNAMAYGVVALAGIPLGAAGTTARKLYRTVAGSGQLQFVATINDNTTTTYTDSLADGSLGANVPITNTTAGTTDYNVVPLTAIPLGGALVTSRKIYRTAAGGSQLKFVATLANNTATTYTDSLADGSLGANIPITNTAAANQVALAGIQIGGASVTSRKLYRTVAAGSQLKLLATLADNTTTTYADSTADASLGANVPTSDASGLTQPNGQVAAGSTSLIVAGTSVFAAGGGWAVIGNGQQVIRYTGVTATALTGIPASGAGAIVASIGYNSTVTAAPSLTGIPASGAGSVLFAIVKGDQVNLLVQEDDVASQALLSSMLDPLNLLGGAAGIQEDYQSDGRISRAEAVSRATARLALQGGILVSISYTVRDPLTKSGRTISVNLPAPQSITDDFLIQKVTISAFSASPDLFPTYTVDASSATVTFEQLLAALRGRA